MALLGNADKDMFDGFIRWRREAAHYINNETEMLIYLILFGSFPKGENHSDNTPEVCRESRCSNCKMYKADRCHEFVKKKYAEHPNRMREVMKDNYAKGDWQFWKQAVQNIEHRFDMTKVILIVGAYRYELFKEEFLTKAVRSAQHHNRVNRDNNITVPKDKDPKYYSMDYIQENDFWSMYKETQLEGDLLCSILSDF